MINIEKLTSALTAVDIQIGGVTEAPGGWITIAVREKRPMSMSQAQASVLMNFHDAMLHKRVLMALEEDAEQQRLCETDR